MLQVSVPSYTDGSTTFYNVLVILNKQSHEIPKRFSDFEHLAKQFQLETGDTLPVALPPKSYLFQKVDCEARRSRFEAVLRALARIEGAEKLLCLSDFFELPRLVKLAKSNAEADQSQSQSKSKGAQNTEYMQLLSDFQTTLIKAKGQPQNTSNSSNNRQDLNAAIRRQHIAHARILVNKMQKLHDELKPQWPENEKIRRQNTIDEYQRQCKLLERQGHGMTPEFGDYSGSPNTHNHNHNHNHPAPAAPRGRVLGETDESRGLSNSQLLQFQQSSIEEQDERINELLSAITRQKQLGLAITDEVTKQNQMLDELDGDVQTVNAKLNLARRKAGEF